MAKNMTALLGPSYNSASLFDIHPMGIDVAFSMQKQSLYSYEESYVLQRAYYLSHTFQQAIKNGNYLASNIAWEGRRLKFDGMAQTSDKHYIDVTDELQEETLGRIITPDAYIKAGEMRQGGLVKAEEATVLVKKKHTIGKAGDLQVKKLSETTGELDVSGNIAVDQSRNPEQQAILVNGDLVTHSGSSLVIGEGGLKAKNLIQHGGEVNLNAKGMPQQFLK